jgi:hypothetical protein
MFEMGAAKFLQKKQKRFGLKKQKVLPLQPFSKKR